MSEVYCPICRSIKSQRFYRKGSRVLMICRDCRHIFWDKAPTEGEIANLYRSRYGETRKQADKQRKHIDYFGRHLKSLIAFMGLEAKSTSIVDFGCSFPYLLVEAKSLGFSKVVGVDWDQGARQVGEEHGIAMLSPEDFGSAVPDRSIDIIRFSHVLEHTIDPVDILRRTQAKAREGGFVYITQPNFPVFAYEESPDDLKDTAWPAHLHFFSPISLMVMVKSGGLQPKRFFTHLNAEQAVTKHIRNLDVAYAASWLKGFALLGDLHFGRAGNYPLYAGENSVVYATRAPVPL